LSYSFKDGKKCSVTIVNLDVDGESFHSNNEPEHEAQVFLKEAEIKDFKSGYSLTVPAASMMTIVWTEE